MIVQTMIMGEWVHSKPESTKRSHNLRQEQEVLSASVQSITTKMQYLVTQNCQLKLTSSKNSFMQLKQI